MDSIPKWQMEILSSALEYVHLPEDAVFLLTWDTCSSDNFWYVHKDWMERKRWVENLFWGVELAESQIAGRDQCWRSCFFGRIWLWVVHLSEGGMHIAAQNSPFHNGIEVILKQCDLYLIVFKEAFNVRGFSYWFQNLTHFRLFVCLLLSLNLIHK